MKAASKEMETEVPRIRIRSANEQPIEEGRDCIVYWMTAFRRTRYNFALQYAIDYANHLGKPLVILEALRLRYRWA
ncbi:MAG: deoxyribodipyrimidine photolyase, partial [Planctomycetota bacterium]